MSLFVAVAVATRLPSWYSLADVKAMDLPIFKIFAFTSSLAGLHGNKYFTSMSRDNGLTLNSCKFNMN